MDKEREETKSITSPPGGKTHEATTPPGQGDLDKEALKKGQERWAQVEGGV
jgi:hypothetical protein